jgi:carbon-monoxide dehydrogenase iron sulfur subunit
VYRKIVIRPNSCMGCRSCELICSYGHFNIISPKFASVKVYSVNDFTGMPLMCMHCDDPECIKVCTTAALHRNEKNGAVEIDHEKCIHCAKCVVVCKLGNIHNVDKMILKCDLCGGLPKCVEVCPTGAIDFIEIQKKEEN